MKKIKTHVCLLVTTIIITMSGCSILANNNRLGSANISVRVVDDTGQSINGVHVDLFSLSNYEAPPGLTDITGETKIFLRDIHGQINGHFTKSGYYKSNGVFWNWGMGQGLVPPAGTNFTIVLKRIIEPIPMRQKEIMAIFPRLDEPIGYDLVIGDWVAPDGKGETADMMLSAEKQYVADDDFITKLFVEFVGEHNGIQSFHYSSYNGAGYLLRSELPPPPIAPESGYIKTHESVTRRIPNPKRFEISTTYDKDRMWIYRIRTEVDDDGKIVKANYGWMTKDLGSGSVPNGTVRTSFNYYYNPDPNSRSLEPKEIADRQGKVSPFEGQ